SHRRTRSWSRRRSVSSRATFPIRGLRRWRVPLLVNDDLFGPLLGNAVSLAAITASCALAVRDAARLRSGPEETLPDRYFAWGRKRSRFGAASLAVVLVV